jgi:hypothetical protein
VACGTARTNLFIHSFTLDTKTLLTFMTLQFAMRREMPEGYENSQQDCIHCAAGVEGMLTSTRGASDGSHGLEEMGIKGRIFSEESTLHNPRALDSVIDLQKKPHS